MIGRKTVRQVLKGTGWNEYFDQHSVFREYFEVCGNCKCKMPAFLKRGVNYYDLHQKFTLGYQFIIFQGDQILHEFYRLNPFETALCLCYRAMHSPQMEILEYSVNPTQQPISVLDLSIFHYHFEEFTICKMDETLSRIERLEALSCDDNLIAVSKKPLRFGVPLIIIFYSPTT